MISAIAAATTQNVTADNAQGAHVLAGATVTNCRTEIGVSKNPSPSRERLASRCLALKTLRVRTPRHRTPRLKARRVLA